MGSVQRRRYTNMKLGDVIRGYRLHKEMNLRQLGDAIGIGHVTLMRIENGHEPSGGSLAKIIAWLTGESE